MLLQLHRFLPRTRVEGPGERACLWVQGCPIQCRGCAVPHTWSMAGGEMVEVEDLATRILSGPPVEGVTFLGGEPFVQAAALAYLGHELQAAGLGVVTFTGYAIEDLQRVGRKDWLDLLAVTDLLIDGPYRADLRDFSRPWVGSLNKRYHFLTPRYRDFVNALLADSPHPNCIEVRIGTDGRIELNGMAETTHLDALFEGLVRRNAVQEPESARK